AQKPSCDKIGWRTGGLARPASANATTPSLCIVRVGTVAFGGSCEAEGNFLCVPLCPLWLLINTEVTEESCPAEQASIPTTSPSAQPSAQTLRSDPDPPHSIRAPLPDWASRASCSAHTDTPRRLFPKPSPHRHTLAPAHRLCNTSV